MGRSRPRATGNCSIATLSSRDEAAFEAIVNLHGPMVLSLCRRFLRDPRDIEDAFQATFLVLARKAGSIRNREVLSSWLYGVAYRIAVRSRAEVLRRRSVETGVTLLDDRTVVAARDVDEIGPVLDQELSRLPEKYRAPIVLCYLKEQTHDQAAAELRWPVGTVRSRLARGRELLKQRLTRRGCSPATAMLIAGPGGSIRSFTAAVPQPLVQATVAAAGRYLWGTRCRPAPRIAGGLIHFVTFPLRVGHDPCTRSLDHDVALSNQVDCGRRDSRRAAGRRAGRGCLGAGLARSRPAIGTSRSGARALAKTCRQTRQSRSQQGLRQGHRGSQLRPPASRHGWPIWSVSSTSCSSG